MTVICSYVKAILVDASMHVYSLGSFMVVIVVLFFVILLINVVVVDPVLAAAAAAINTIVARISN